MKIAATQYSLQYKALEIYISGCDGYCNKLNNSFICAGVAEARCHNPELWDYQLGTDFRDTIFLQTLLEKISLFNKNIEYIFILGGEPLLHKIDELEELLDLLSALKKKIVLFTRFDEDAVEIGRLKPYLFATKFGAFDYALRCNSINNILGFPISLASKNQIIKKWGDNND
ncbi:4Fe-4S cluster-binding domain-containing protein [Bacteroides sp.]|uniref:4Fe-4S cluster-binding domain-containing protein n=1 Tax=Bacteroides sp. TaxID=29523 RepID=UPI002612B3CC|nr:4Fe-4S cluster-binding domain-containing protein [Bacteroides sp.]MDD3039628.1 4Fe-4S cluster-binding domain-containing protein [Bacteroides sp.]